MRSIKQRRYIKYEYKKNGFTLIELLVVIAIIGILASVILVSLNDAKKKAHDAKEVSQLKQVAKALEAYYASGGNTIKAYEDNNGICVEKYQSCGGNYCEDCSSSASKCFLKELQKAGYLTQESVLAMFGTSPADHKLKSCFFYLDADPQRWKFATTVYSTKIMKNDGGSRDDCYEVGSDLNFILSNKCSKTDDNW